MASFVLMCIDKPGSLPLRMATRDAHLAYARERQAMIRTAGPILDAEGGMAGSLFIIEAADLVAARAFHAADPYTLATLWERVELHQWRQTLGALPPEAAPGA